MYWRPPSPEETAPPFLPAHSIIPAYKFAWPVGVNHADDLPCWYQFYLECHSAVWRASLQKAKTVQRPLALATQLAYAGTASWFCFNSSPRGCDWSSFSGHSWSSPGLIGRSLGQRVGAGRGGAEGWRKCLLSQVTRGADASTHETLGSRSKVRRQPPTPFPNSSLAGLLKLPSLRTARAPTNHSSKQRTRASFHKPRGSVKWYCPS